jgi:hypothetical protein
MTCSTSYLSKIAAFSAVIVFLVLSGCAAARKQTPAPAPEAAEEKAIIPTPLNEGMLRAAGASEEYIQTHAVRPAGTGLKNELIAVLPIENLSGTIAPLNEMRRAYIDKLKARGVAVLSDDVLDSFMAKHRVRFTGGIDRNIASLFASEIGVREVLITSLELYSTPVPPKIAIVSRLVATGPDPAIKWMDDSGRSGDDSRGLLDLGYIRDAGTLTDKSLDRLSDSLAESLAGVAPANDGGRRKFRPKYFYRSPELDMGKRCRVVVAPFFNQSGRRFAEEIVMLQFIEHLYSIPGIEVVEPGVVREHLLRQRVVMDEGLTMSDAEVTMLSLGADLIFMGSVFDYEDYQGPMGRPTVDFTAQVIERKSMREVWSSKSRNEGDQGVFFFDRGRVNTADEMTSEMVGNVIKEMREKQD